MKKIQKRMCYLFVLAVFLCEGCTTTKTIFVPPLKKEPTVYQIYQVVLDTFQDLACLLYTSPSPRDRQKSRMPSSA